MTALAIGIYAAVVATLALAWNCASWFNDRRPKIRLQFRKEQIGWESDTPRIETVCRAINVGRVPITITSMLFEYERTPGDVVQYQRQVDRDTKFIKMLAPGEWTEGLLPVTPGRLRWLIELSTGKVIRTAWLDGTGKGGDAAASAKHGYTVVPDSHGDREAAH